MAAVAKWLTQPAVNRSLVGSIPIGRPIRFSELNKLALKTDRNERLN